MKKLYLFSGDEKYIEKCKKFFNYFEINIIDKKLHGCNYSNMIKLNKILHFGFVCRKFYKEKKMKNIVQ